jgi:hypothetical protein
MAWLLIRTFLITPVVFVVAALIVLTVILHAGLDNRFCAREGAHQASGRPIRRISPTQAPARVGVLLNAWA